MNRPVPFVIIAALALLSGCEPSAPLQCHPVRGKVVRNGKPVVEAMVVFHPVVARPEVKQKPLAFTDEAGEFAITTFQQGDGAPTGQYRITVEQRAPKMVGEEMVREGPNLLPRRFGDPNASGLTIDVAEGDNVAPPIEIPVR